MRRDKSTYIIIVRKRMMKRTKVPRRRCFKETILIRKSEAIFLFHADQVSRDRILLDIRAHLVTHALLQLVAVTERTGFERAGILRPF